MSPRCHRDNARRCISTQTQNEYNIYVDMYGPRGEQSMSNATIKNFCVPFSTILRAHCTLHADPSVRYFLLVSGAH